MAEQKHVWVFHDFGWPSIPLVEKYVYAGKTARHYKVRKYGATVVLRDSDTCCVFESEEEMLKMFRGIMKYRKEKAEELADMAAKLIKDGPTTVDVSPEPPPADIKLK
jgi:hypothetical protein